MNVKLTETFIVSNFIYPFVFWDSKSNYKIITSIILQTLQIYSIKCFLSLKFQHLFSRKLDKDVIGKFTVIMADPPWDIHMELPYGTMTDDEMRNLGVEQVQVSRF